MYKMIVGLGNPGPEFQKTRHNLGFVIIDYLAAELIKTGVELKFQTKFKGSYAVVVYRNQKLLLLKPQTYMNKSGGCVKSFVDYYQIDPQELIIIYDDLSIPVGQLRYREKGSSGGHNGMLDIIRCLGTKEIRRLKVGIGSHINISGFVIHEWVMKNFTKEDLSQIKAVSQTIQKSLLLWIANEISFSNLMSLYNCDRNDKVKSSL